MIDKLKEGIDVVRKLTFPKLWNIILLKTSYYLSIGLKKDIHCITYLLFFCASSNPVPKTCLDPSEIYTREENLS